MGQLSNFSWFAHANKGLEVMINNSCAEVIQLLERLAIALGMLLRSFVEFSLLHRHNFIG